MKHFVFPILNFQIFVFFFSVVFFGEHFSGKEQHSEQIPKIECYIMSVEICLSGKRIAFQDSTQ